MVATDVMMALLMDMLLVPIILCNADDTCNVCNTDCNGVLIQSHSVLQSTLSTTASAATDGTVMECIEPLELFTQVSDNSTLQLQCYLPPMRIITLGPCIHWICSFFSQT